MKTHALNITPELLKLVAEIDSFNGGWQAATHLSPDKLNAMRHVATIESIGSSTRIEGAKLSDQDVEQLLGRIGQMSFGSRDEQEVAGYAEVMDTVFQSHNDIPLTENYLKQLHAMLLRHSTKDERHRGQYKTLSNNVEAFNPDGTSIGIVFKTAEPFDTPRLTQELLVWTRETLEDKALHPLITIGIFKVVFLAIHPFQDGNGRLSRVMTTLLLLKAGYSYVPYSSLESIIERNKDSYYLALRRTQQTLDNDNPDWLPWLQFFMRSLKSQKDHLQSKLDAHTDTSNLPEDSAKILAYLESNKRISMREARELTGTPRPTLKLRFNKLIEDGRITRHGMGRGTWYRKS